MQISPREVAIAELILCNNFTNLYLWNELSCATGVQLELTWFQQVTLIGYVPDTYLVYDLSPVRTDMVPASHNGWVGPNTYLVYDLYPVRTDMVPSGHIDRVGPRYIPCV